MSELFSLPNEPGLGERGHDEGHRVHLPEQAKLDILREQGLSAQELQLLAKYSQEEHFLSVLNQVDPDLVPG